MEHRAEPRFPVRSPIRVIVPGDPARILSGELIDVSATGMRFLADEQVTPDEIIAIEVDSRLVLVEIRYCQTRGYKFVVGVKRLQEIAKGAELKDSGVCATEMIWDLRRHISAGGEGDLQALAMKALEKIVERSEISAAGDETGTKTNPAGSNVEPLPSQPPPQATSGTAAYGKATNGIAGDYASSPAHKGGDPAESESAEIELQEPAEAPIGETILQDPAGAVPHVLQAEVIEAEVVDPDVIKGDEGDVIEVDDFLNRDRQGAEGAEGAAHIFPSGDHADTPVAVGANATFQPHPSGWGKDVPAETVPAGIELRAPDVAEPPVVAEGRMAEPVTAVAEIAGAEKAANVASVPIARRAPNDLDAARQADPHLAALRAEVMAGYEADASVASARGSRSWRVPVGIAAALILACTITFFLVQRRTQASSLAPPIQTHTTEVAPSPAPDPPAAPAELAALPASIPPPDKTPANKAGVHHVEIKIVEASWVTLVVDGGKPLQTMLYKGDVHEFGFSQKAFLRLGNAAGVEIALDGASVGPLKGKVVVLEFTPQGMHYR